jgi:hypothetical protein
MQIGLMWYDDDPRKTLDVKIEQAAARYHEKFGQAPNACYVNPAALAAEGKRNGLRLVPARSIRPGYLWIGVDEREGVGSRD